MYNNCFFTNNFFGELDFTFDIFNFPKSCEDSLNNFISKEDKGNYFSFRKIKKVREKDVSSKTQIFKRRVFNERSIPIDFLSIRKKKPVTIRKSSLNLTSLSKMARIPHLCEDTTREHIDSKFDGKNSQVLNDCFLDSQLTINYSPIRFSESKESESNERMSTEFKFDEASIDYSSEINEPTIAYSPIRFSESRESESAERMFVESKFDEASIEYSSEVKESTVDYSPIRFFESEESESAERMFVESKFDEASIDYSSEGNESTIDYSISAALQEFEPVSLDSDFFEQQKPKEWFPIKIDGNNKISFSINANAKKIKQLIYIFRNHTTDEIALIGKTGTSFAARMNHYKTKFNKSVKPSNQSKKKFITAVQNNPTHFEVAILYVLKEGENLDTFETGFIKSKKPLYNQRNGGGGGLTHSEEESAIYAIPKNPLFLTPKKRFRFRVIDTSIRPEIDQETYKKMLSIADKVQGILYSIKEIGTEKRYIGYTTGNNPHTRIRQHGYQAQTFFPFSDQYDPEEKDGALHPAMGQNPEGFSFGFLPILHDLSEMKLDELDEYAIVSTIGEAEKTAIKILKTLVSQGGFNCNGGGGGPISGGIARRLNFD
ncbi:hypothetical protein [Candidatus Protochlamydia sp. R18]|uniref:hypothetical protein n=1 Tax=Candidatus Protochlamydia sp. R18 TaxID=1353977 RepID=UPI0005A9FD4D|nr:hypothetical protein [Candidatus Protochlamydia sp. R18]